jgi:hypothetical protein
MILLPSRVTLALLSSSVFSVSPAGVAHLACRWGLGIAQQQRVEGHPQHTWLTPLDLELLELAGRQGTAPQGSWAAHQQLPVHMQTNMMFYKFQTPMRHGYGYHPDSGVVQMMKGFKQQLKCDVCV